MKNEKLIETLKFKIEDEGLGYAIEEYGLELARNDEEFAKLRNQFLQSINHIRNYLGLEY